MDRGPPMDCCRPSRGAGAGKKTCSRTGRRCTAPWRPERGRGHPLHRLGHARAAANVTAAGPGHHAGRGPPDNPVSETRWCSGAPSSPARATKSAGPKSGTTIAWAASATATASASRTRPRPRADVRIPRFTPTRKPGRPTSRWWPTAACSPPARLGARAPAPPGYLRPHHRGGGAGRDRGPVAPGLALGRPQQPGRFGGVPLPQRGQQHLDQRAQPAGVPCRRRPLPGPAGTQ